MEPIRPGQSGDLDGDIDGAASGHLADPERLESAPPVAVPRILRRVVIGVAVGGAAVILAVALLGESIGRSAPAPAAVESPSPTTSSTPVRFPSPRQPTPTPPRPAVFGSSGFLADVDVVVYARSGQALFRIDTAARRVTRTAIDDLDENGSVTLLALSDRVLILPADEVGGYVVVDGESPRRLRGQLAGDGQSYPGPAGRVWTISSTITNGKVQATLTDKTGRTVYAEFEASSSAAFYSDGAGGLFC